MCQWVPGHGDTFLVSHASGNLYTYQAELDCSNLPPQYQYYKGMLQYHHHNLNVSSNRWRGLHSLHLQDQILQEPGVQNQYRDWSHQ